jgi:hypothetical protein
MLISVGLLFPASCLFSIIPHELGRTVQIRYDQYAYSMDRAIGTPSFAIGRYLAAHALAEVGLTFTYNTLLPASWIMCAAYLWHVGVYEAKRVLAALLTALVLAAPIYVLLPVSGPRYAFSQFPNDPPHDLAPRVIALTTPPNGMPSVHMTIALLLLWYSRKWKMGFVAGGLYALCTVASTLGLGEHYVVDLLAAVPFALLILWLSGDPMFAKTFSPVSVEVDVLDLTVDGE